MTAVELRQTLEREFEVYLTPQEIRNLTFAHLEEIATKKQQTEMEDAPLEGTQAVFYGTKLFGDMGPVRRKVYGGHLTFFIIWQLLYLF
jgi:hypothetical protein